MPVVAFWNVGVSMISRDSHQNIRLHTGARVNVVLLTYLLGAGPLSDNNFQPIASFVLIAMLGNEMVVATGRLNLI